MRLRLKFIALCLMAWLSLAGCLQALPPAVTRTVAPGDQEPTVFVATEEPATVDQGGESPPTEEQPAVTDPPEVPTDTPAGDGPEPVQTSTEPLEPTTEPDPPTPAEPTVEVVRPTAGSIDAWRAQQESREPFEAARIYQAPGQVLLFWFDPKTQQHIPLGWVGGALEATARFRLRGTWVEALEIPYVVNQSFGIVLSEALVQRIRAAGHNVDDPNAAIDTYVYLAPDMSAQ